MTDVGLTRKEILKRVAEGSLALEAAVAALSPSGPSAAAPPSASGAARGEALELPAKGALSFYSAAWCEAAATTSSIGDAGPILLIDADAGLASALADAASPQRQPVIRVELASSFSAGPEFSIRPDQPDDAARLIEGLALRRELPVSVVHAGGLHRQYGNVGAAVLGQFMPLLAWCAAWARRPGHGPLDVCLFYRPRDNSADAAAAAVAGFGRALALEDPRLSCRSVALSATGPVLLEQLRAELQQRGEIGALRHAEGRREKRRLVRQQGLARTAYERAPRRGLHLVTGGLGALGRRLAEALSEHAGAHIVLTGRRQLDATQEAWLRSLARHGARADYHAVDVASEAELGELIQRLRVQLGRVRHVFHCAGVLDDALVVNKSVERVKAVLAPKLAGTSALHELTRVDEPDTFVAYASIAGALGSAGQTDYAYANDFLSHFAEWRSGVAPGRSLSIDWPLWQSGGMRVSAERLRQLSEAGYPPLTNADGLDALWRCLSSSEPALLVWPRSDGPERLGEAASSPAAAQALPERHDASEREALAARMAQHLRRLLARHGKIPAQRIGLEDPFDQFGIDSLLITTLIGDLERELGTLPKTLFFEYPTLLALARHLVEARSESVARLFGVDQGPPDPAAVSEPRAQSSQHEKARAAEPSRSRPRAADGGALQIAIVGVSGRYPKAADIGAFWSNLRQGIDCISEIPRERWPLEGFFDPTPGKSGLSYSKWGGFLDDVDRFDALFFNIAPSEAKLMDPQERVFLEVAWSALEDAGYTRKRLASCAVGVFVGAMYGHYQLLGLAPGAEAFPTSSFSSIANRVSYFCDFRGPSLAVDTMCSSSLTAIHLACRSLLAGECDVALAGGVNLSLHPYKYQLLSLGRFAASDGRCRSFGEGGDGYVPGEGAGVVVLKRLDDALRDQDDIRALIQASAVNHGGKTSGYTVPNPNAQAELIARAWRQSGVHGDAIGYIEAHGTGTALGDPIEIAGLSKALSALGASAGRPDPALTAIGSVKSNIGHLEAAAGVAALTKVLLQLEHRELVPSLHATELNRNIDFAQQPFRVQRELAAWPEARLRDGRAAPRAAAISAFGAGGSNAHLVIEEFVAEMQGEEPAVASPLARLFVVSARDAESLTARVGQLLAHLCEADDCEPDTSQRPLAGIERQVLERAATELGLNPGDLDVEHDLRDYGLGPGGFHALAEALSATYSVPFCPADFSSVTNVSGWSRRIADALTARDTIGRSVRRGDSSQLVDLAYTLQVGREPMPQRLAIVANTLSELVERFRQVAAREVAIDGVYTGARAAGQGTAQLLGGKAGASFVQMLLADSDVDRLALMWASGADVDWQELWSGVRPQPRRLRLPTYPFARQRHWVSAAGTMASSAPPPGSAVSVRAEPATAAVRGAEPQLIALEEDLRQRAARVIGLDPSQLDAAVSWGNYGFESLHFAALAEDIERGCGIEVTPVLFFEYDSVRALATHLQKRGARSRSVLDGTLLRSGAPLPAEASSQNAAPSHESAATALAPSADSVLPVRGPRAEPVAIVGYAGRFPGSCDVDELWRALVNERDLISETPEERWDFREYALREGGIVRQRARFGGFMPDVDQFDARFFQISAAEAEMMDPQQRLLLETAWQAIEDAGYAPSQLSGARVGLFVGAQFTDYGQRLAAQGERNPQMGLGNELSILVNRVSYLLNLRGPSEPYNTACSSALVALHRAVGALRSGEVTAALAGGVSAMLSPHTTLAGEALGILSPDGRCKTLDASADGYVRGEGVGLVLLKLLRHAVADGDDIRAVIRGTAVNHGGRASSLTAPSVMAQKELLIEAYEEAAVPISSVGYVELHGTGTKLGDPIEIEALKAAFTELEERSGVVRPARCGIGSLKTNIGHLEPAAGIAGLLKAVLALQHGVIPATLHLRELNPYVRLENTPFFPVRGTQAWPAPEAQRSDAGPRRAGVSSFGFGGVNAHVVLEQAPHVPPRELGRGPELIVLSAKSPGQLASNAWRLAEFLADPPSRHGGPALEDVGYTLRVGREAFAERVALVADDIEQLVTLLRAAADGSSVANVLRGRAEKAANAEAVAVPSEVTREELGNLARRWVEGAVRLTPDGTARRRVRLPTYPFERRRHWALRVAPAAAPVSLLRSVQPAEQTDPAPSAAPHGGPSQAALVDELRALIAAELKADPADITPDVSFTELGVDSVLGSVITQSLTTRYGDFVPFSVLVDHPTLLSLARYMALHTQSAPGGPMPTIASPSAAAMQASELVALNPRGSKLPSFWVHGGPGYAAIYSNLTRALGPDYPFFAFQARGVDGKSIPRAFEDMVEHYQSSIQAKAGQGPYLIGGYSYGGLVAYEVARRLQRAGGKVDHLVIFDTLPSVREAYEIFESFYGHDDHFLTIMMANEFAGSRRAGRALITRQDLDGVPQRSWPAHVAQLAKQRGTTALSADEIYNYIRGCIALGDRTEETYLQYRAEPYDASPILYFKAREFLAGNSWLGAEAHDVFRGYDYVEPWRQLAQGGLRVVELPSDHFNMLEADALGICAEQIRALLGVCSEAAQ